MSSISDNHLAAIRMAERGWHLMPIRLKSKNPGSLLGGAWQEKASCDVRQIEEWVSRHGDCNWGVLLGASSGIIDVEDDSPEGREILEDAMAKCGILTPCYTSGKSIHRLFLYDERAERLSATVMKAFGTEWRFGNEPAQSIVPPSLHENGKYYTWIPGLSPEEVEVARLPDQMWDLMLDLKLRDGRKKAELRATKRAEVKTQKMVVAVATAFDVGEHTQHVPAAEEAIGQILWGTLLTNEGWTPFGELDWTRPGTDWSNVRSATLLPESDRLHVWTNSGPVDEGHYSKWRFWYQSHGFTDREQVEAAKSFLGEERSNRIQKTFQGLKSERLTVERENLVQPLHNAESPLDEKAQNISKLAVTFAGKAAGDIWELADEYVEWLVEGIFSADQPTIFGAKQKSLKTTLLTDLAVSLSSGYPWLGKFTIPKKRRVLFITGESSERAAIRKVRRAAESRNLRREDFLEWLRIEALNFPTLPSPTDCAIVKKTVKEFGIEVIVVDPLYMGLSGVNTTNLNEVGPALRNFMASCRPASVVIAHHVKKTASFDDAPNLEDLSQAGIAEFAGNYWLMGRMSEYTGDGSHVLAIRYGGRDEQFGLLKLTFDEKDWQAEVSNLVDHREDQKQRKDNERANGHMLAVKRHLDRHGGEASLARLAEAAGTKPAREPFQRLIDELCESGHYERCTLKTNNNRECDGLRVRGQMSKDSVP